MPLAALRQGLSPVDLDYFRYLEIGRLGDSEPFLKFSPNLQDSEPPSAAVAATQGMVAVPSAAARRQDGGSPCGEAVSCGRVCRDYHGERHLWASKPGFKIGDLCKRSAIRC